MTTSKGHKKKAVIAPGCHRGGAWTCGHVDMCMQRQVWRPRGTKRYRVSSSHQSLPDQSLTSYAACDEGLRVREFSAGVADPVVVRVGAQNEPTCKEGKVDQDITGALLEFAHLLIKPFVAKATAFSVRAPARSSISCETNEKFL